MGKRGVSKIEGPSTIKLGEEVVYSISRVHRKEDIAKGKYAQWILYVEESGKWRELKRHPNLPPKIGDTTTLVITNQNLLGKRLLLEAYMYSPEKTAPPGIIIKVEKGGKKKIEDIQLLMADEKTPITKKTVMRYGQSIIVKVQSINMQKEKVTIYLYEDDEKGKGHSVKNEKNLVDQVEKTFDDNGLITHTFKLPIDFSKIANTYLDRDNDQHHEYYIHIKSEGLSKTSVNFEVLNPEYIEQEGKIAKVVIIGKAKGIGIDPIPDIGKSVSVVGEGLQENKELHCGEKFCIKKGDKNELIREVNIRLAGFGGNVPTDEFTERTEKMIKQFQRDYMEVPETGKICGNVLRAIDEFSYNFDISESLWKQLQCSCSTKGKQMKSKLRGILEVNNCDGFGDETGDNTSPEKFNKYEYPGIHRSLLFGLKTIFFYLSKQENYSFGLISSGYRCRFKNYGTTNHQGKAIDIQFNKGNWKIRGRLYENIAELENIRKDIFYKYLNAKTGWTDVNSFSLEPIGLNKNNTQIDSNHTYSWIHMDVRTFDKDYLADQYFCKNITQLNGKSIVQLAIELGFINTCSCYEPYKSQTPISETTVPNSCEDKFKRVAPIILKHEGGFVNDANDSGGMTNKGITIGTWRQYAKSDLGIEPTEDNLRKLTDEQATIIYRKRYWEPKGFCKINDERVGLMVYDWSITSGGAGKQVQKLLVNEFEQDISIDGSIGPKTIEALNNVQDQDKLLNRIAEIRKQYYTDLAYDKKGKPTKNLKFLKGWHNRVDECLNYTFK